MGIYMCDPQFEKSILISKIMSIAAIPFLLLTSGCFSYVSAEQGYSYGHHSHVAVGAHGNASGAAVVGALIVGGIIGSMINETEHERKEERAEKATHHRFTSTSSENTPESRNDELVNGYTIDDSDTISENKIDSNGDDLQETAGNSGSMQWFQYGKDRHCYLMSVNSGVTDVVSVVNNSKCQSSDSQ